MTLNFATLRRYAVARSLFAPTTLLAAIKKLGFLQADPIRSPARAQDLILRHRVKGYCAGDLERRYPKLAIEEDFFINYGFLPRELADLMHPRTAQRVMGKKETLQARQVLAFVQHHGAVHPDAVDAHFQHGTAKNWFGGNTRACTQLLDAMHYRGMLRTAKREGGTRLYAVRKPEHHGLLPDAVLDRLLDTAVKLYAPLPEPSLHRIASMLANAVPQFADRRKAAVQRAKGLLARADLDGTRWYWPADENPASAKWKTPTGVRFLAPFDPVVWDRHRFELLWGWAYRFEAYTPAAKRVRGYYAMPMLVGDQVLGWANVASNAGALRVDMGWQDSATGRAVGRTAAFKHALGEEIASMKAFLDG